MDIIAKQISPLLNDGTLEGDLDRLIAYCINCSWNMPKAHIRSNNEEWIVKFPSRLDSPSVGKKEYEMNA